MHEGTQNLIDLVDGVIKLSAIGASVIGTEGFPSKEEAANFVPPNWVRNAVLYGIMTGAARAEFLPGWAPTMEEMAHVGMGLIVGENLYENAKTA